MADVVPLPRRVVRFYADATNLVKNWQKVRHLLNALPLIDGEPELVFGIGIEEELATLITEANELLKNATGISGSLLSLGHFGMGKRN